MNINSNTAVLCIYSQYTTPSPDSATIRECVTFINRDDFVPPTICWIFCTFFSLIYGREGRSWYFVRHRNIYETIWQPASFSKVQFRKWINKQEKFRRLKSFVGPKFPRSDYLKFWTVWRWQPRLWSVERNKFSNWEIESFHFYASSYIAIGAINHLLPENHKNHVPFSLVWLRLLMTKEEEKIACSFHVWMSSIVNKKSRWHSAQQSWDSSHPFLPQSSFWDILTL